MSPAGSAAAADGISTRTIGRRGFLATSRRLALTLATIALGALAAASPAGSQSRKTALVGILVPGAPDAQVLAQTVFVEALRERGWIEGENLTLDVRYANGRYDRLPALAADLVRRKPDVIFAVASPSIQAAMRATTSIPIVIETLGDAQSAGLVRDLARPGGNVTGVSGFAPDLVAKRLQLVREIVPKADAVGVLANLSNPTTPPVVMATESAARQLPVQVHVADVREARGLPAAFDGLVRKGADALLVVSDPMFHNQAREIVALAERHRLPAVYEQRLFLDVGGLMSYGPGRLDRFLRAAAYVDRILRGAKPAELPIERPTKFELVVNLRAAGELRLAIPRSVMVQADDVIQ